MYKFGQEIIPVLSGTIWPVQVAQYDRYIHLFLGFLLFLFSLILILRQISIQNVDSQHSILSLTLAANVSPSKNHRV